jgi:uncharacterized damage-inducible protein DinB
MSPAKKVRAKKRSKAKKTARPVGRKPARRRAASSRKRAKKPARLSPATKRAKRSSAATRRVKSKGSARKPAKPGSRATKRAKSGRGAKKQAARRGATARSRARLALVKRPRRPASRPPSPPAFQQTSGASPKQLLLFELMRARTAVLAAIQGLTPGSAEKPVGAGNWSVREIVLHLATRDRIRVREMEAVLRGVKASWVDISGDEQNAINEHDLTELRHLSWDESLRLLHAMRQELIEDLESLPEEPADVWIEPHPFGWMMQRLPAHDRHHADAIKRWRASEGA